MIVEERLRASRTARYFVLGDWSPSPRQVWVVCHGYAQLARRFAENFDVLSDGRHMVVAPEGLSRFYLPGTTGHSQKIGASWMTREDRLSEIADYVNYLNAVHDAVFARLDRDTVTLVVLGFSQGVATVCRWVAAGHVRADHVVLWAAEIPPELDLKAVRDKFDARTTLVRGDHDELVPEDVMIEQQERLRRDGISYNYEGFAGGHHLDPGVIALLSERLRPE